MNWRIVLLALLGIALLSTSLVSAELPYSQTSVGGPGSYGSVNLEAIHGVGQVKLNGTTVAQLHLTGSLIASSAQIGSLDVSGEVNLSDSQVKNQATITGYLRAQKTTFERPIFLALQRAVFTHSKMQGVTVRQNMGFKGKQVLELRQNTTIQGPVVFEGGKGEIHLYSGSKVIGEVTGAKILQK